VRAINPLLGSYSSKSETNPGKYENIRAKLKHVIPQPGMMHKTNHSITNIFGNLP